MAAQSELYRDIATRTGGDIYIGVVGPVRTGKSTLIKRFMETMVLPRIESEPRRSRAADELPQSAAGRTIMTTEPKFIPEEAVSITLEGNISLRVRMIDCVGYIVPSALGYIENQQPRMVMTPWYDKEVPFNMAAEVGTRKVINEHSTIGLVVTTDGSISEIPRTEYEEAEARVVRELQAINKPFVVVLNCQSPKSPAAKALRAELEERYGVPVAAVNCLELDEEDIAAILGKVLVRFPLKEAALEIPAWVMNLAADHWLKEALYRQIRQVAGELGAVGSAGATLQKQEQWQIVVDAVGRANHAVEELDALGRAGDWCRHSAAAHGAADGQEHRLQAAPVKGDVDAVVLDVKAGDVVRSDEGHVSLPFVAVFRVDQFYRRGRGHAQIGYHGCKLLGERAAYVGRYSHVCP